MWRPPERVRHGPPAELYPTAEEASRAYLFQPLTLASGLVLRDRTWVPAMVPWRASEEGLVTPAVLAWYSRFAEGEPGALVVEATGIRDVPSGPLLRAGGDRFVEGLGRLAETVRARSGGRTRVFVQLLDFLRIRRRPEPGRFFREFLEITKQHRRNAVESCGDARWEDAPEGEFRAFLAQLDREVLPRVLSARELEDLDRGARERVTDTHLPWLRDLPRALPGLFAEAARRVERAGFDGVELHYAHAYTMSSFLSALNTREDGYGGGREARVRLPREVFRAVRAAVGRGFTVGCRFLCDDVVEGGNTVADACWFGVELAREGMDYLSLSTGGRFEDAAVPKVGEAAYPYTGRSGFECMPPAVGDARGPYGRNVWKQARVRAAVRAAGFQTPVVVAGGLGTFAQAEAVLRRGEGDLVGAARQTLADPDWWRKVRLGRGREVRRCGYTNYCEALDQHHRAVTCQLWDRLDLGEGVATVDDGRRRLTAPAWVPGVPSRARR